MPEPYYNIVTIFMISEKTSRMNPTKLPIYAFLRYLYIFNGFSSSRSFVCFDTSKCMVQRCILETNIKLQKVFFCIFPFNFLWLIYKKLIAEGVSPVTALKGIFFQDVLNVELAQCNQRADLYL